MFKNLFFGLTFIILTACSPVVEPPSNASAQEVSEIFIKALIDGEEGTAVGAVYKPSTNDTELALADTMSIKGLAFDMHQTINHYFGSANFRLETTVDGNQATTKYIIYSGQNVISQSEFKLIKTEKGWRIYGI